jgi:membrane protein DedA with SNARE-associated domain
MPDSVPLEDDDQHDTRRRPPKRALAYIAAPLIALIVIANIGDALAPGLVDTHPLVLIMMNARNRNLILVTNYLDAFSYYVVGTVRLLISDPLFFLLGYWYGDNALKWMERRTKTFGETLRMVEKGFGKASYPLVFIAPNNFICLFAGAAGMRVGTFFALNLSGTITRLYLIRRLGEAFERPIDDVLDFIKEYRLPLLAVSIVAMIIIVFRESKGGEIDSLAHLDEELDKAAAATEAEQTLEQENE